MTSSTPTKSITIFAMAALWGVLLLFFIGQAETAISETQNAKQVDAQRTWADKTEPMVPERLVALVGVPFRVYFDNLILAKDIDAYHVAIEGIDGKYQRRYWEFTPTAEQIGVYDLTFSIQEVSTEEVLSTTSATLIVSNVKLPEKVEEGAFSLLIVGDSMTHQSSVANRLFGLLSERLDGRVRFVGTHQPFPDFAFYEQPLPAVFHEGYGGWTWERFSNHYKPDKAHVYHTPRSPFVFLSVTGPQLDLERYFTEQNVKGGPDAVIFQLGVNDTFNIQPDDVPAMEAKLDVVMQAARDLLTAFHESIPASRLLVQTPPYFTSSNAMFDRKYGDAYGGAERHQRIVAALIKRMLDDLSHLPGVEIVPTHLMLDREDGYDRIDPGHPNGKGSMEQALATLAPLLINPKEVN